MLSFVAALEPAARITVATLFNSLWEAAVLAFAIWTVLRIFPNMNATTRYAAWCVALIGSLLLPIATAAPQISVLHAPARGATWTYSVSGESPVRHRSSTASAPVAAAPVNASAQHPAPALKLPERLRFALPEYVALALFGVWLLATLLLFVRLAVNLLRLEHLKRDALPLPIEYREKLSQWALAPKGEREVRLCVCDSIEVPVAVGLFDSMILIPQHLIETLSVEEVDQIMLHELGHLRRADDWTNGVQRIIQALFFFNPAILYIAAQLDLEREVACDDWVVHQTKSVRPYATCLTKMAEVTAWPHRPLAAPGVFVTRRGLSVRVERLLRAGRNVRTSISFGPAGAVVAALVVLFFLLQSVAPSFAFTATEASGASPSSRTAWKPLLKGVTSHNATANRTQLKPAVALVASAVAAKPSAQPSPTPKTQPGARDIVIPAQHIHIPERTIPAQKIPAINVDIPARRIHMHYHSFYRRAFANSPLPPDFSENLQRTITQTTRLGVDAGISAAAGAAAGAAAAARLAASNGKWNCVGCDYSGQNLSGKSFRGQRLNGSDFSNANLQNADFSNAQLAGVDFSGANLQGANFSHAIMTGCDLGRANISGANFEGTQMTGCSVDAKALSPTQARTLLMTCRSGCDFTGVNLRGQNLRGVQLSGVDLSDADLRGADLSNARLSGVDFSGAHLDGARFAGAMISGCDLSGVDLRNVDLTNARLVGDRLNPDP